MLAEGDWLGVFAYWLLDEPNDEEAKGNIMRCGLMRAFLDRVSVCGNWTEVWMVKSGDYRLWQILPDGLSSLLINIVKRIYRYGNSSFSISAWIQAQFFNH